MGRWLINVIDVLADFELCNEPTGEVHERKRTGLRSFCFEDLTQKRAESSFFKSTNEGTEGLPCNPKRF